MKDSNKEYDIIKLVMGHLDDRRAAQLRQALRSDIELRDMHDQYDALTDDVERLPLSEVPAEVPARFEQWLRSQVEADQRHARRPWTLVRLAKYGVAASVLVLAGWFLGTYFGSDHRDALVQEGSKAALMQLISTESPTNRIKGINESYAIKKMDREVGEALIKLLINDESINVRLAAVDAMRQHSGERRIKDGLLRALESEQQPIVQISIINALVGMDETRAKATLENLIEKEDTPDFVKDEARLGLTRL